MNWFKTFLLMSILMGLALGIGYLLGGQGGMVIGFGLAVIMNFGAYWFSDKVVLRMYGGQEVTEQEAPKLFGMVRKLAQQANLPMPRVYIIPSDQPNAFATGRDPEHAAVAVTEGIMRILSDDELEGVIAHELAHVKNRDMLIGTIAATFAGAVMMIANMARWAMILGSGRDSEEGNANGLIALIMIIVAPIAALLIQMSISRSREFGADEGGARISGKPWALANALKKLERGAEVYPMDANPATAHMFIVNPFSARGIATLFSTHPPISERVERLERMV